MTRFARPAIAGTRRSCLKSHRSSIEPLTSHSLGRRYRARVAGRMDRLDRAAVELGCPPRQEGKDQRCHEHGQNPPSRSPLPRLVGRQDVTACVILVRHVGFAARTERPKCHRSPTATAHSAFRNVLRLALALRRSQVVQFLLGHRIGHRSRRTLQRALFYLAAFRREGRSRGFLLSF